ncbi:unnamed protein product, partial [Bubo scandiacus]
TTYKVPAQTNIAWIQAPRIEAIVSTCYCKMTIHPAIKANYAEDRNQLTFTLEESPGIPAECINSAFLQRAAVGRARSKKEGKVVKNN